MNDRIIALPCICFSVKERDLIQEHGFVTYPEFLDNGFVKSGWSLVRKLRWFKKRLYQHQSQIQFVVAPDNMMKRGLELKKRYPAEWIYPLHHFSEVEKATENFEFVGFPHRIHWRNYTLRKYLAMVPFNQRWYLGFWNQSNPEILLQFRGFDTTIPETISGKYGKLWEGWNQYSEASKSMKIIDMFHYNLHTLQKVLEKLFKQKILKH